MEFALYNVMRTTPKPAKWLSPAPTHCNLCKEPMEGDFVDGKTRFGPWAIMCKGCHFMYGYGLGTGKGQLYSITTLEKMEG